MMTPRRFDWALRSRGAALDSWPETERVAALALLRQDAAARRSLADALAEDDDTGTDASDRAALVRMQGAVRRALAPPPPVVRGLRFGALAACLAAGLYLGAATEAEVSSLLGPLTDANLPATVLAALDP